MEIRIGTRGSKLALWQANYVAQCLHAYNVSSQIVVIETTGDKILNVSLSKIGSKGVFTKELEEQLYNGSIDVAVHSAKDLPSELPEHLEIIAYSEREKSNDVVLSNLPDFSLSHVGIYTIGTSSTRRLALMAKHYPQHVVVDIRGNLQTRIKKMEEGACDALLLAYAGVHRMGFDHLIKQHLPMATFVPQAGQGAIALQALVTLQSSKRDAIVSACNHSETQICIEAERAFLRTMHGGCSIPAFVHACKINETEIHLHGGIIHPDGDFMVEKTLLCSVHEASSVSRSLATWVLKNGGEEILLEVKNRSGNR